MRGRESGREREGERESTSCVAKVQCITIADYSAAQQDVIQHSVVKYSTVRYSIT